MDTAPITVVIPTIPPRTHGGQVMPVPPGFPHIEPAPLFLQATRSVSVQTVKPAGGLAVAIDTDHEGAAITRQRALDLVTTEFSSFFDDDDLMYEHHIETHWRLLREHGADVAYSWFDGNNPFPKHRGRVWDADQPHHTTMTITVRTELAKAVGFYTPHPLATKDCAGEDFMFILGLNDLGAKFVGTDVVTWHYRLHGYNTSGLGTRW
jgi:hypothetical protein